MNINLTEINNVDFDNKDDVNKYTMLSVADLDITIDSLLIKKKEDYKLISSKMHNRSNALVLNDNIKNKIVDIVNKVYPKIVGWYDNEAGYSARLAQLTDRI